MGHDERWFATARTATKAENMQGFHEDNMLFIVDEASGVAEPIMTRYGDDKTVIGYKINEVAKIHKKIQGQDTMRTAADIALLGQQLIDKYKFKGEIAIKVDDGGVGGGVVDRLRQIKSEDPVRFSWMDIIPVQFGRRIKHKYYYDTTTYMMAVVKDLLSNTDEDGNEKPVELILPNDNDLVAQLSCRKYEMTTNSKIKIESKDDMKARDLSSPDEADCILLLCLPVKRKKGENAHGRENKK